VPSIRRLLLLLGLGVPACGDAQTPAPTPPPLEAAAVAAIAGELLPPETTRKDLSLLVESLQRFHPGLYRYQTRAEFEARVAALRAWFAEPRSRSDTYLALARFSAAIRCSHTYLNFWNQSRGTKQWLLTGADKLPVAFVLDERDRWVVLRSAVPNGAIVAGDTIVAINDRPTPEVIAELLPAVRGDGDNDGKRRSLLELTDRKIHETMDALLPRVMPPIDGHYRLAVRRGAGHATVSARDTIIEVATITAETRRASATPLLVARPSAGLRIDGTVGVLHVDGFEFDDDWERFLRRSFEQLREARATALIVDLRENEGGSDDGALALLRYLIRAPLPFPPVRHVVAYQTVPDSLRPFLNTWDDSFYDRRGSTRALPDGRFALRRESGWPRSVQPMAKPFAGRILVLTGPVNSSASHTLVRVLKGAPGVTMVGAPTGGSLRASTGGNLFFLRLPGSGLEADVPLIGYEWGADQPSGGVEPDVRVPEREALAAAMAMLGEFLVP
jgi:hypothetical protein